MFSLQKFEPKNTFIFKQWSHKAYAVFISLNKEVSIGVISIDISTRLATKNEVLIGVITNFNQRDIDEEEFEEADIPISPLNDVFMIGPMTNFLLVHLFIQFQSNEINIHDLPSIHCSKFLPQSISFPLRFIFPIFILQKSIVYQLVIIPSITALKCLVGTEIGIKSTVS